VGKGVEPTIARIWWISLFSLVSFCYPLYIESSFVTKPKEVGNSSVSTRKEIYSKLKKEFRNLFSVSCIYSNLLSQSIVACI